MQEPLQDQQQEQGKFGASSSSCMEGAREGGMASAVAGAMLPSGRKEPEEPPIRTRKSGGRIDPPDSPTILSVPIHGSSSRIVPTDHMHAHTSDMNDARIATTCPPCSPPSNRIHGLPYASCTMCRLRRLWSWFLCL